MPERYRLCVEEGATYREIGGQLGITKQAVHASVQKYARRHGLA